MTEFFFIIIFSLLGGLFGCATGLLPGLHVNNLALILISISPVILSAVHSPLLVCIIITSISIAHTFVNLIPSTFLGAPDENALSILPAHKMLLEGNGYGAVFISSVGSFGAVVFGFLAMLIFRYTFGEPLNLYLFLNRIMLFLLIGIAIVLLLSENAEIKYEKGIEVEKIRLRVRCGDNNIQNLKIGMKCSAHGVITKKGRRYFIEDNKDKIRICIPDEKSLSASVYSTTEKVSAEIPHRNLMLQSIGITATVEGTVRRVKGIFSRALGTAVAAGVFILSGIFGFVIFRIPSISSPLGLPSSVIFPAFAGLFGISTLIFSANTVSSIPKQKIQAPKLSKRDSLISIFTGSAAGSVFGFIPGITSGHATVLSMIARKSKDKEQTLLTLSAVNTSYAFFCVIGLFVIGKARNGTALAVNKLINIEYWNSLAPPNALIYLLAAILISSCVSYFVNLWLGKKFAKIFSCLPYKKLVFSVVVFIAVMVFVFTGFVGILILIVAVSIGLLPQILGVRRSHCMGMLLMPIIINLAS